MRIVDLDLMPYEIEVEEKGYTLIRIDTVKEGANAGLRKEITEGYFGSAPANMERLLQRVARDKVMKSAQKMNLQQYFKAYNDELTEFSRNFRRILGETLK